MAALHGMLTDEAEHRSCAQLRRSFPNALDGALSAETGACETPHHRRRQRIGGSAVPPVVRASGLFEAEAAYDLAATLQLAIRRLVVDAIREARPRVKPQSRALRCTALVR